MTGIDDHSHADHRRQLLAVLLCILLGGALLLLSASRPWLQLSATRPAPFGELSRHISGRTEFGAVAGLAVVVMLGAVLGAVTGKWARFGLGLLLAAVSLAAGWYGVRGFSVPAQPRLVELISGTTTLSGAVVHARTVPVWPALGIVGAALSLIGSAAMLRYARRWPAGLSARYEAPAAVETQDDPWRALDRGDDPTIADR